MMVASLSIAALLTGAVSASMGSNDVRMDLTMAADAPDLPQSSPCSFQSRNLIIGALEILDAYRYFTLLEAGGSFCGASLIAPDMLLTAAQCRYEGGQCVLLCQHFDLNLFAPLQPFIRQPTFYWILLQRRC
jgi:hypothetical protein